MKKTSLKVFSIIILIFCFNTLFAQADSNKKMVYNKAKASFCTILTPEAQGSGFFIATDLVATNFHLFEKSQQAEIVLHNQKKYEVEGFVALDKANDLIILKVKNGEGKAVKFTSEKTNQFDEIIIISSPSGMMATPSSGDFIGIRKFEKRVLMQIDAKISPGSSGAPVFNAQAELIGVAVANIADAPELNFAIPANLLQDLMKKKEPIQPLENLNKSENENPNKPFLDDETFKAYKAKALQKTEDLGLYIGIISDKKTTWQDANKAIDLACALFVNEESIIEVSNLNAQEKRQFKIRDYFKRLKLLKYDKTEVEWTDIQYVSELRLAPDGFYHGIITIQQKFSGYKDGQLIYGDMTRKNLEVVLKTYTKFQDGKAIKLWDVFLGDVGVRQTS